MGCTTKIVRAWEAIRIRTATEAETMMVIFMLKKLHGEGLRQYPAEEKVSGFTKRKDKKNEKIAQKVRTTNGPNADRR